MRLRPHGGVAGRLKMLIPPRGGTARRPTFAENLHLRDRYEVPPSGGALNPDPHSLDAFICAHTRVRGKWGEHCIYDSKTLYFWITQNWAPG